MLEFEVRNFVAYAGKLVLLWATMGEGDVDFSNPEVFAGLNSSEDFPTSCSMDSFFDKILEDNQHHACTHTHTCNPPGPGLSHTHTCFHVHTRILPAHADETAESAEKCSSSKKRPCGNKEAVRKYRQKKKAHTASMEEELSQLKMMNQQLMRKLQNQTALEAEVSRLRCLLVDLRGRIEGELGSFPYQSHAKVDGNIVPNETRAKFISGAHVLNSCGFHSDDQVYCFGSGMQKNSTGENRSFSGQEFGACEFANVQCAGNSVSGSEEALGYEGGNGTTVSVNCLSNGLESEHKQFNGSDVANHS